MSDSCQIFFTNISLKYSEIQLEITTFPYIFWKNLTRKFENSVNEGAQNGSRLILKIKLLNAQYYSNVGGNSFRKIAITSEITRIAKFN